MIGKTLAHYEILAKIGAGGMGEVYRAHDTKLGRDVAIKVLPKELSRDPERVARFRREARTLASLHHPHVASIFGLEDVGEDRLLVMELVEGEDLGQRLRRGPLPLDEALDIARQIAEGLEAAHEKEIVHRDLKPANVKVTPAGEVKILDFGLARAFQGKTDESGKLDENSPTLTAAMTRVGTILGTAAYMSPEQARGKRVDRRTDVWALGCVLYEMLAGRRCFVGANVTDVLAAVVKENPDWSCLPDPLPWRVRELLEQTLQKDPRKRLRDMGDVGLVLERAQNVSADSPWMAGEPAAAPSGRTSHRHWAWLALGLVIGGAAVGALTWLRSNRPILRNPLAGATITRLTDFAGDEINAAISPDGRFVTFASDRGGEFDLLVGQVGSRDFRNVTNDGSVVTHPVRAFGFNWDGSEIWIGSAEGGIRMTSLLGGSFRNFLGEEAFGVDWSPDGRRLLYRHTTGGDPLFVADRDGANSKLILDAPDGYHQHYPTWSADGEWIYLVRDGPQNEPGLWRVRPDGSRLEQVTEGLTDIQSPTSIDQRTVLFCARDRNGAGPWLWMFDAETGASQRVSFGVEQYTAVDASRDGHRLVATVADPQVVLWRVPILDAVATEAEAAPFPMPTVRAGLPRYGPDALFYVSSRGTGDTVWRYRDGEPTEVWSGSGTGVLEDEPAVAPTGDSLALVVKEGDRRRILILSTDGAQRRELPTGAVEVRGGVAWSPHGRWLAAGGLEDGKAGLFKLPTEGGAPTRIADGEARRPVWSPRGDLIVFAGPQIGAEARLLAVRPDGRPVEIPEIKVLFGQGGTRARFLPDGRGLVYMQGLSRLQDFYVLDLASMETQRLTRLEDPAEMRTFDITPDGAEIVFDRMNRNSDIVLIELEGGSLD